MADASQLQLNPYALFDPSQWQNPYSNYQNTALPAASYVGMPTNYAGQLIQPQPGMTINQTPAQPAPAPAMAPTQPQGMTQQQAWMLAQQMGGTGVQGSGRGTTSPQGALDIYSQLMAGNRQAQPQAAAPTVAQPGPNSAGLTPQQYMALRANPGPVPTYGATVPASSSSAQPTSTGPGGQGVLQSFLQNWKPAQSGAGSGFQQGFNTALRGMGY